MSSTTVRKYDPYQGVDLPTCTNSMENRRVPKSVTSKVFSGSVWYTSDPPISQQLLFQASGASNTMAGLSQDNAGGASWMTGFNTMPFPEQLKVVEPVPVPRRIYATETRFTQLQKWECTVLEVKQDAFTARLIDQTGSNFDEEAEFPLAEVDTEDRDLVEAGAVFYWNIGYRDQASGRERISTIRFRRLPVWTSKELKIAAHEAARVRDKIDWK